MINLLLIHVPGAYAFAVSGGQYSGLNNSTSAKEICSSNPKKIEPNVLAVDALEQMRKFDINQLLVVKEDKYLGILQLHDLVREGII